MTLPIISKAYTVWHDGMIGSCEAEKYLIDEVPVVYASSPGQAKLLQRECESWEINGRPHQYIDLKCKRAKDSDIVLFEGQEMERRYAKEFISSRKIYSQKLRRLNKYPDDALFYIQSGFSGNALILWAQNSCGYTTHVERAHRFTKQEIERHILATHRHEYIWPVAHIQEAIVKVLDSEKANVLHRI